VASDPNTRELSSMDTTNVIIEWKQINGTQYNELPKQLSNEAYFKESGTTTILTTTFLETIT